MKIKVIQKLNNYVNGKFKKLFFYPKIANQKIFKKLFMNYFTTLKIDFLIRKTMANLDTVFIFTILKNLCFYNLLFFFIEL